MSKQWKNDLEALYQQSRQELPPPELDQKIRVSAKKAVQRKSPNLKWYLSSAAVVLLAVNVVLFIYVPESEVIEIPRQSSPAPLYKALPKATQPPSDPAKMMEPRLDTIEKQNLKDAERRLQREVQGNISSAKKSIPELNDFFNNSLQTETDETSQVAESNEASGSVKQSYDIRLPKNLPFDVHKLIAGHPALTGRQLADSLVIYQNNKLILKMKQNPQGEAIEAYPEARLWGVYAQWGQNAKSYKECSTEDYLICDLTNEIQGGFENDRLIFIRWMQKNEP
jgi:hypothetical protein